MVEQVSIAFVVVFFYLISCLFVSNSVLNLKRRYKNTNVTLFLVLKKASFTIRGLVYKHLEFVTTRARNRAADWARQTAESVVSRLISLAYLELQPTGVVRFNVKDIYK